MSIMPPVAEPRLQDAARSSAEEHDEDQIPQQHSKWRLRLRPEEDEEEQDWWWASTAIPLFAATTGPLANLLSIAALVTSWRNTYPTDQSGNDDASIGYPDPRWCLGLNGTSLACGCIGNIFLLFNFTERIRYIVALPMTIILWYFAFGILIAIMASMDKYVPPQENEVYSQGFWYAVIAAVLYMISSMALMLNMLGYFLGHYPRHFELTDEQRSLIIQTMMFFAWLAIGGGVFSKVEDWSFPDALYFCDITILTIGFGDFHPTTNAGRGLVFPYSVGGIVILGLVVSSIHGFAKDLGRSHVARGHAEKRRNKILDRSTTDEETFNRLKNESAEKHVSKSTISEPSDPHKLNSGGDFNAAGHLTTHKQGLVRRRVSTSLRNIRHGRAREPKIILLKEERTRFDAMRSIQHNAHKFKSYSALTMSIIAFGLLWFVGAIGFWKTEARIQGMTYFKALYLGYVSLLTIGYGDLAPQSNAGKPLFVVWSLIAVPTMTILISDMGDTVIGSFKRGTFAFADWTVLPKAGVWREFAQRNPRLWAWTRRQATALAEKGKRRHVEDGLPVGPEEEDVNAPGPTLEDVAQLDDMDSHALARRLVLSIRHVANELRLDNPKRYTYEQWAEYTRLIRFTKLDPEELGELEVDSGLVDWDWLGEDSPLVSGKTESEWIMDRLCESLERYMFRQRKGEFGHGDKSSEEDDGVDERDHAVQ